MEKLSTQPDLCPICGSTTSIHYIDYMDWSNGHILVIRQVPVRECHDFGHQFMAAQVAKKIERLFGLDQKGSLSHQEILSAPVVNLNV
ncbi:MAG: YgiT-type zinc finger protein [Chloroflexi bacterium]|nr:YgiT-type zinc finger protein [Chloroflexota bacterium]